MLYLRLLEWSSEACNVWLLGGSKMAVVSPDYFVSRIIGTVGDDGYIKAVKVHCLSLKKVLILEIWTNMQRLWRLLLITEVG